MSQALTNTSLEYAGLDDVSQNSTEVNIKTEKPGNVNDANQQYNNESKQSVINSGQKNVLNSYRSITYNFTLSALENLQVNNPDTYRDSETKYVILKSGGKGTQGISAGTNINVSNFAQESRADAARRDPRRPDAKADQTSSLGRNFGNELISGFNSNSPGRFDMFIENVEIETLMAPTLDSNSTLPTQVKFDVIEPFSVNGFIEAMHVTSISAGYSNYISCCFLLKMEFWGYPDSDTTDFKDPVKIPKADRYFPIGITGIEVDITEKGTRYRVSAVPYNERAFGQPSTVKKPIKMSGTTVGQILKNLMENVSAQVKRSDDATKSENLARKYDEYEIKFVNWAPDKGFYQEPSGETDISKSKLTELHKDNNLYKMVDPATSTKGTAYKAQGQTQPTAQEQSKQPENIKYSPGSTVVQFSEGMNIHDIIISVIRDSEYTRNILKDIKKNIDQYGRINYFMVKMEVTNIDKIDEVSKKPYQKYTFVVSPYKIHYTRIPLYGSEQIEEEKLSKLALREYDYIYTGQNVDVINFKLNFNTLFFEAVPADMGNKDSPSSRTGVGPTNDPDVKTSGTSVDRQQANAVPLTPTKTDVTPVQYTGGNASQPLDDPYSSLARNMHESIINSKASLITGELDILGDPLYIATNGVGNYNGKPEGEGKLSSGDLDHLYSEVLIRINFRNPIDIMPLEQGGVMHFDANRVPFSGVYRVNKASSSFKEGVFKQKLEIIRIPGQILDYSVKPTDPSAVLTNTPSPDDRTLPDSTRATPSFRPSVNQTERGFPDQTNNFINSPGGLGGTDQFNLNRTYGVVSRSGALVTNSSPIGQALPTDIASGIRLQSANLAGLSQNNLSSAALVAIATNVITGNLPTKRAIGIVAGAAVGTALTDILKRSNIGSGIGEGATLKIDKGSIDSASATAQEILSGQTFNSSKLPLESINDFSGSLKSLGTSAVNAVSNIGKNVNSLVNNVDDKLSKLTASSIDPEGIAAKVNLNTAALSGLSMFPSKALGQIKNIANSQLSNVNLSQAVDSGLLLQNIPSAKIKNIPATQPYSSAPDPIVDKSYLQSVVAAKGITGLENLYGVNSISKISSNILPANIVGEISAALPSSAFNPLSSLNNFKNPIDSTIFKDKLETARNQLSGLTGIPSITDRNVLSAASTKFGSLSQRNSPLDKLVNNLNDPNAPPYTGSDPIIRNRLGLPPLES